MFVASAESVKRSGEAGVVLGQAKRSRDLITWVKKHRRPHIRRDDLLAYLTGKLFPPHTTHNRPHHRYVL